jgi:hypothetical protein
MKTSLTRMREKKLGRKPTADGSWKVGHEASRNVGISLKYGGC